MTTKNAGKAKLLGERTGGKVENVPVSVDGADVVITVRPLTRGEAMPLEGLTTDPVTLERKLLAAAIVAVDGDPCRFTEGEVGQWQNRAEVHELTPATEAVLRLSGMATDAVKEEVTRFRD